MLRLKCLGDAMYASESLSHVIEILFDRSSLTILVTVIIKQHSLCIFKEYGITPPEELRHYEWSDFMGEAIKADKAVNIIRQAYAIAPQIFSVKRDKDLLLLDLSKANLSPKDIDSLKNELPVATTYTCVGSTLPIQLSSIAEYAGIDFKKDDSWLSKLQQWFRGK